MANRTLAASITLGLLGFAFQARATLLDPRFEETSFATVPGSISGFAWAPDATERLFLLRKTGQILLVEKGVALTTPFANIQPIVTPWTALPRSPSLEAAWFRAPFR